jgi:hypothetical protein
LNSAGGVCFREALLRWCHGAIMQPSAPLLSSCQKSHLPVVAADFVVLGAYNLFTVLREGASHDFFVTFYTNTAFDR